MRRPVTRLFLIALVAVSAPLVVTFVREVDAVDRCLDAGGSFDYSRTACDHAVNHPFVPFTARHRGLVRDTSAALAAVLVFAALAAFRGRPST